MLWTQAEDHNWIFNWSTIDSNSVDSEWMGSVLSFNTLPPKHYRESTITLDFDKTNAIVSDSLGEILFYSNGQAIYGGNHSPIVNGDTINYSPKWDWLALPNEFGEVKPNGFRVSQLISIIPWPDDDERWMILYQNSENVSDSINGFYELWQAEVIINEDDLFEVVEKDKVVNNNLFRHGLVTACQHANGRDWWLLQSNKDTIYTYLIDPDGIKLDHLQIIDHNIGRSFGQSKFSNDGSQFAYFSIENQDLLDNIFSADIFYSKFDRCSGYLDEIVVKNYESILSVLNNGIEFSSNGDFLYIAERERILQFDTREEDFLDNPIVVGEWDGFICDHWSIQDAKFGLMQRGLDGKIYISGDRSCYYIHTIDNPNNEGLACNFNQRSIRLESFHIGTVPNFNTLRLGPLDGSPCDTLDLDNNPVSKFWYEQDNTDHQAIQFRDVSYFRPEEWSWTFGDGNTSGEMSPLHTYSANGIYEVCLTVSNENSSHTSCQELQIGPVANSNIGREYDISIFPNPVEDFTRLVFHDYLPEQSSIFLHDANGSKVFSSRVYQESMIDFTGLQKGVYFFEVIDGSTFLISGKIVKL